MCDSSDIGSGIMVNTWCGNRLFEPKPLHDILDFALPDLGCITKAVNGLVQQPQVLATHAPLVFIELHDTFGAQVTPFHDVTHR